MLQFPARSYNNHSVAATAQLKRDSPGQAATICLSRREGSRPAAWHNEEGVMSEKTAIYQSYRCLPTLAGLATIDEAARPGLSVEACVARLKRYHYAFRRLHEILTARITAEPVHELKTGFSLHAYLCSEHVQAIRTRSGEMREPPLGLEDGPHAALEVLFDEIRAAPTTEALLLGVYEKALPALDAALERHRAATNPLVDAPSLRVLRFARVELADMIEFGKKSIACLVGEKRAEHAEWLAYLDGLLQMAGAMDGVEPPTGKPERWCSKTPYVYD